MVGETAARTHRSGRENAMTRDGRFGAVEHHIHAVAFKPAQGARSQASFPTGACDWAKPGVEQQDPLGSWVLLG
jgi:hypothetical protein